jgi:V/A-type H+-transporting ATPase subunit K
MNPWLIALLVLVPFGVAIAAMGRHRPRMARRIMLIVPIALGFMALGLLAVGVSATPADATQTPPVAGVLAPDAVETAPEQAVPTTTSNDAGAAYIGAAIAVAASALGAGIAIAYAGSAALAAVSEQPDLFGRVMVVVGLAEGVAIYGLIVAVLILGKV